MAPVTLLAWPSLPLGALSVLSSLKLFLPQVRLQSLLCVLSENEGPQGSVLFDSLYPVPVSDEKLAVIYYLILLDICIFFFFQLHSRLSFCFHFQWSKYKTPDFLITMFSLYLYFSKVEMEADLVIEILLDSFSSCKMLLSCPLIFTVSQTKTKTKTHLPEILLLLLFLHRSHIWLSDCFKYFHFVNHFKSID